MTEGTKGAWRKAMGEPRARLFIILSVLWFFPSLGALWILIMNRAVWGNVTSAAEFLASTRLEQWVALALLLAHGLFVVLALQTSRRARTIEKSGKQIPADAV